MTHFRLGVLAVALATALTPLGTAIAAPTSGHSCSPTPETPTSFCVDSDVATVATGTSTPATAAGAPVDATVTWADTSSSHTTDQGRWLSQVALRLGTGGLALKPSSAYADGTVVAGSATGCTGTCPTAGSGTALLKVTDATPLPVSAGTYTATVVVRDVHNDTAFSPATYSYTADAVLTATVPGVLGSWTTTFPVHLTGNAASGLSADLSAPVSGTAPVGLLASGDFSLDSLSLTLPDPLVTLPATCGSSAVASGATDRAGDAVEHTATLVVDGCPGTPSIAETAGQLPLTVGLTTPAVSGTAGRTLFYHWDLGGEAFPSTTQPAETYTFDNARPRAFSVYVQDDKGATGPTSSLSLAGTRVSATQPSVTRLTGRVTDWTSKSGLAAAGVRLYRCAAADSVVSGCTLAGSTTSSSTGAYTLTIPRPTGLVHYLVGTLGTSGRIGGGQAIAARPQPTVTLTTSATSVKAGRTLTLSGAVTKPSQGGQKVYVERKVGTTWKLLSTRTLTSTSRYSYALKATTKGTWTLRVRRGATTANLQAISPIRTVKVS